MIREARRKAAMAGVSATFEVGDAERLAIEDASFDLVICNSAFTERSRPLLFGGVESVVIHPPVTVHPPARQRRHLRMSLDTPETPRRPDCL